MKKKRYDIQDTTDTASSNVFLEEKEVLAALINSIQDEIWFADKEGNIRLANPAALCEFNLEAGTSISVEGLAKAVETYRPDGTIRRYATAR